MDAVQEFGAWCFREFPEGIDSAARVDMQAAFLAGVRLGQQVPTAVPRMPPLPGSARFDTAEALRLAGKRGEIHPADAVAFIYPDVATFERYAASNRVNEGVDAIGPLEDGGRVVGIVDLRRALFGRVTDPSLPDG